MADHFQVTADRNSAVSILWLCSGILTSLRSKAIRLIPWYACTLSSDPSIPQEYELFAKLAGPDALTDVPKPSLAPTPTTEADSSEMPFDPTLMTIPPAQDPLLQYIAAKITPLGMHAKATRLPCTYAHTWLHSCAAAPHSAKCSTRGITSCTSRDAQKECKSHCNAHGAERKAADSVWSGVDTAGEREEDWKVIRC